MAIDSHTFPSVNGLPGVTANMREAIGNRPNIAQSRLAGDPELAICSTIRSGPAGQVGSDGDG
jgi:hypothetical protein